MASLVSAHATIEQLHCSGPAGNVSTSNTRRPCHTPRPTYALAGRIGTASDLQEPMASHVAACSADVTQSARRATLLYLPTYPRPRQPRSEPRYDAGSSIQRLLLASRLGVSATCMAIPPLTVRPGTWPSRASLLDRDQRPNAATDSSSPSPLQCATPRHHPVGVEDPPHMDEAESFVASIARASVPRGPGIPSPGQSTRSARISPRNQS